MLSHTIRIFISKLLCENVQNVLERDGYMASHSTSFWSQQHFLKKKPDVPSYLLYTVFFIYRLFSQLSSVFHIVFEMWYLEEDLTFQPYQCGAR